MSELEVVEKKIAAMSEEERREMSRELIKETSKMVFIPNPGPQTQAYFSEADVLLYGGSVGGGKSALGLGLALNEHYRSLVVREHFSDTEGLIDTCKKLAKTKEGFIGGTRPKYNKDNGGVIHFAGLAEDGSIGGHQGIDHDFLYVDEAANIPEKQIRLLMGWLRTDRPNQRTRVVLGSNPPLDSTGDWLLKFFAPWLDPTYPNPAKPGEIRYFLPDEDGNDFECQKGEHVMLAGVKLFAQSRSFIPSRFTDNPYYNPEEYSKTLSALDKSVREILISGNFLFDRPEGLWQLIPRKWVDDAVKRWHTHKPAGVPMSCVGVDIAQGGSDSSVLARRFGGWFDKMVEVPGKDTPEGKDIAALVVKYRRDACPVVLDMGGGYGGAAREQLENNGIKTISYKGTKTSTEVVKGSKIGFPNIRSEAYWSIRSALDPSQPGGSRICLPDDQRLISELCTPEYRYQNNKYKVESKEEVVSRLGRSTDFADALVMCWYGGERDLIATHPSQTVGLRQAPSKVILGHQNQRRPRR
jgi:predicted Fe-Mo cluster-binding NifX family protein